MSCQDNRRLRNARRLLDLVMNPICPNCHDTGLIAGESFDVDDHETYEDFTYCFCAKGELEYDKSRADCGD